MSEKKLSFLFGMIGIVGLILCLVKAIIHSFLFKYDDWIITIWILIGILIFSIFIIISYLVFPRSK